MIDEEAGHRKRNLHSHRIAFGLRGTQTDPLSERPQCRDMAEAAGARPGEGKVGQVAGSTAVGAGVGAASGAVGGAIAGAAGHGSMIGAASGVTIGLLRGLFSRPKPGQGYINFVDRCLKERGYEPVGWE